VPQRRAARRGADQGQAQEGIEQFRQGLMVAQVSGVADLQEAKALLHEVA
jgi:hypothetical protein